MKFCDISLTSFIIFLKLTYMLSWHGNLNNTSGRKSGGGEGSGLAE